MFINNFDPVAFNILSLEIRWYSLSYIFGIILGWLYCKKKLINDVKYQELFDDYIFYLVLGIIIGGRLGYILFYNLEYYLNNFSEIVQIWKGGMSFHGALVGIIISAIVFSKKHTINKFVFLDLIAVSAPIGIFFGRIANFINGELVGKTTGVYWGVIFPNIDNFTRHPSQLYEAFLEGLLLFIVLAFLCRRTNALQKPGLIMGIFIAGYGLSRMIVEQFFREPDAHIGYLVGGTTMGFWLSLPMLIAGLFFVYLATRKKLQIKSDE